MRAPLEPQAIGVQATEAHAMSAAHSALVELEAQLGREFERSGSASTTLTARAEALAPAAANGRMRALALICRAAQALRDEGAPAARSIAEAAIEAADSQPDVALRCHARLVRMEAHGDDADALFWLDAALTLTDQLEDPAPFRHAMVSAAALAQASRDWPLAERRCGAVLLNAQGADIRRWHVHHPLCRAHLMLGDAAAREMHGPGDAEARRVLAAVVLRHAVAAISAARHVRSAPLRALRRFEALALAAQAHATIGRPARRRIVRALRRIRHEARRLGMPQGVLQVAERGLCVAQAALALGHQLLARRALVAVRDACAIDSEHEHMYRWRALYMACVAETELPALLHREINVLIALEHEHSMARGPLAAVVRAERWGMQRDVANEFLSLDLRSPLAAALAALQQARDRGDLERVVPEVEAKLVATLDAVSEVLAAGASNETDIDASGIVDLTEIVIDVMGHLEAPARGAGAELVALRLDPAWVRGVRSALWRALVMVVDDAFRHGGRVEIELCNEGAHHRLSIADRGPGFVVGADGNAVREAPDGRLLGSGNLASVRRIVRRAHLGRVSCSGGTDGLGGHVAIVLPAVTEPTQAPVLDWTGATGPGTHEPAGPLRK